MSDLPSKAKLKFFRLQAAASDAAGQAAAGTKRIEHLQEALGYAENTEADTANFEFELSRMRAVLAQHQAKAIARSQLVAGLNTFLDAIPPNTRVTLAEAPPPQLMAGETCRTAVERLRMEIPKLSAEVRRLRYASLLVEEQKLRAAQWVAGMASGIKPHIQATHAAAFKISFDHTAVNNGSTTLAYLAWLNPDALTRRLHQIIDAAPNQLAMTRRERETRLAEATAALLQAERDEEHFIERASDEGLEIERRLQADPCAILGIVVAKLAVIIKR